MDHTSNQVIVLIVAGLVDEMSSYLTILALIE